MVINYRNEICDWRIPFLFKNLLENGEIKDERAVEINKYTYNIIN